MESAIHDVHIHLVFASRRAMPVDNPADRQTLDAFISELLTGKGLEIHASCFMKDHLHLCIRLNEHTVLQELVRDTKSRFSRYMNSHWKSMPRFSWQSGFAAFSISPNRISEVREFFSHQDVYHRSVSFLDEYRQMLAGAGIEFEEKDLFRKIEY